MQLGITLPHYGSLASPAAVRDTAQAAEALGFDSIEAIDHVALPRQAASKYTLGPEPVAFTEGDFSRRLRPLYECLTTLAFVAGLTQRVRLSTGVCVLCLRNPVYNARQIATIDVYSGGRVDLGIGAGWLKEEADAMQMPWDHRGARTDEHIALLRTLWESPQEYVSFHGRFFAFDEIDPQPRPAQARVPILVGGHTEPAKRRAARLGDGWMTSGLPVAEQAAGMAQVATYAREAGRDPESLLWFGAIGARHEHGEVRAPAEVLAAVEEHRALGLHRLVLRLSAESIAGQLRLMEWLAQAALPIAHATGGRDA